jgi:hypothetical protein
VWDVTVFTKNRERLIAGEVAQKFFAAVLKQARSAGLLSDEPFTVDGTLIEAWASRRSFEKKPDPPQRGTGARGRKLLRDTHESKTDPEARLFRRSQGAESRPSYRGHVITENRNGLVVAACVTQSSTKAEREAGLAMLEQVSDGTRKITLGADKGYQEHRRVTGAAGGAACGRVRGDQQTLAELAAGRGAGRSRISAESEETKTSGASIWLDPTRGGNAADQVSRTAAGSMDVPTGSGGVEPATPATPAAANCVRRRDGCARRAKKGRGTRNRGVIDARKNSSRQDTRRETSRFSASCEVVPFPFREVLPFPGSR